SHQQWHLNGGRSSFGFPNIMTVRGPHIEAKFLGSGSMIDFGEDLGAAGRQCHHGLISPGFSLKPFVSSCVSREAISLAPRLDVAYSSRIRMIASSGLAHPTI